MIDITKDVITAATNPETENPSTMSESDQKSTAFITTPKSPSVMIFIGSVRIVTTGFMMVWINIYAAPAISTIHHGEMDRKSGKA